MVPAEARAWNRLSTLIWAPKRSAQLPLGFNAAVTWCCKDPLEMTGGRKEGAEGAGRSLKSSLASSMRTCFFVLNDVGVNLQEQGGEAQPVVWVGAV